jgi:hypothetical protein
MFSYFFLSRLLSLSLLLFYVCFFTKCDTIWLTLTKFDKFSPNLPKTSEIFQNFATKIDENQRNFTKFCNKNRWKTTKIFKILQQKSMKTLIGNAAEKFDTQLWIFYCHSQLEFSAWKWLLFLSFMPSKQPNFYPTLTLE